MPVYNFVIWPWPLWHDLGNYDKTLTFRGIFQDLEAVARDYLGKSIYAGWPHLYEVRVVRVSDDLVK